MFGVLITMKNLRCLLSLCLLTAVLLALPPAVQAQFTFTTNNGAIAILRYTGSDPVVVIPQTTNGYPVNSIGDAAFDMGGNVVASVTIPDSITSIGMRAFYACLNLTNLTMGGNVAKIGDSAFEGCSKLTVIKLPKTLAQLGNNVFRYCDSLTAISVDPGNPAYSSMAGVLFDGSQSMLILCPQGKIGNYLTPNGVANIGAGAFFECEGLTSIAVSSGVTKIGDGAFFFCLGLTNIILSDTVTNLGTGVFERCYGLTSITVGTDNPVYSSAAGVLFNKSQTTLIQCPGGTVGSYSVSNGITTIAAAAFAFSWNLSQVIIPESVTNIGAAAIVSCSSLTAIDVDIKNPAYCSIDGVLYDKSKTQIIQCPPVKAGNFVIPAGVTNVGDSAFMFCYRLTSITIPNSAARIGNGAFNYCNNLTNVSLGNAVTSIGASAFVNCMNLVNLIIPSTVTSLGAGAFQNCISLTNIVVPDGVNRVEDNTFSGCANLCQVVLPNSVTHIGSNAFYYCTSLTNLTIPSQVTEIKNTTFKFCHKLTCMVIPDGVTNIGDQAFAFCYGLTKLTVSAQLVSVGDDAFLECNNLTGFTFPSTLASLGSWAFADCWSLTNLYFTGNAPGLGVSTPFYWDKQLTVYYLPGTTGWTSTLGGRPAVLWNPQAQTGDASFGVRTNTFGFNIAALTGTNALPFVVEACVDLAHPVWQAVQTNVGSMYFSDPQWTNYPGRFYRLRSP